MSQGGGGASAIRIKLSLLSFQLVQQSHPTCACPSPPLRPTNPLTFGMMGCGVISYHFMSRLRILPSQGVWHLQLQTITTKNHTTTTRVFVCVCVFRQASRDLQASCTSLEFQEFSSGYFRSALKLIQQKLPLTEIWIWRKASIDSWTTGLYTPKANNPLQDVTQRDTR